MLEAGILCSQDKAPILTELKVPQQNFYSHHNRETTVVNSVPINFLEHQSILGQKKAA
jgi:hypothetical protein